MIISILLLDVSGLLGSRDFIHPYPPKYSKQSASILHKEPRKNSAYVAHLVITGIVPIRAVWMRTLVAILGSIHTYLEAVCRNRGSSEDSYVISLPNPMIMHPVRRPDSFASGLIISYLGSYSWPVQIRSAMATATRAWFHVWRFNVEFCVAFFHTVKLKRGLSQSPPRLDAHRVLSSGP